MMLLLILLMEKQNKLQHLDTFCGLSERIGAAAVHKGIFLVMKLVLHIFKKSDVNICTFATNEAKQITASTYILCGLLGTTGVFALYEKYVY